MKMGTRGPHFHGVPKILWQRSPLQSTPLKRPPVGRPSKCRKTRLDSDHEGAVSSEYQRWVDQEKNHEACFLTFCGTCATDSTTDVPRKHRGIYTAEKRMEVHEYIAATSVSIRRASVEFNIPKSTIQDIKSSTAMPPKGKVHKKVQGGHWATVLKKDRHLSVGF